jgi:hypothetical protein
MSGERNHQAKLTNGQVMEIRRRYRRVGRRGNGQELADEFGVDKALINRIVLHKAWSHLALDH